jgi:hypothetical protein
MVSFHLTFLPKPYTKLYFRILLFLCFQTADEKTVLNWMVASITRIQSALNILMNQILTFTLFSKYRNFAAFSKDLLAILLLRFCPDWPSVAMWLWLWLESSFEASACQDMSLGAEELNWVGSCRIMVRKELDCEKKTSCVIWSDCEIVINPLPGYD